MSREVRNGVIIGLTLAAVGGIFWWSWRVEDANSEQGRKISAIEERNLSEDKQLEHVSAQLDRIEGKVDRLLIPGPAKKR
jgi:hypothetical protein